MKEIKFRQPIFNKDGSFKEWFYWGIFKDTGEWIIIHCPTRQFVLGQKITDPMDSQRFTGLKDKNKKDIYEGDICNRYHLQGIVSYHAERAMFILQDGFNEPLYQEVYGVEIIGNVYETPNLVNSRHEA